MKNEPEFLVNEFLEGQRDELKDIIKVVTRKPRPYDRKAAFLKEFTFGLFEAYRREKFVEAKEIKAEIVKPEVVKKPEVKVAEEIKKPVKLDLAPPPKPRFIEEYRNIIVSSTGKVFAKAVFKNGIYSVEEPRLDGNGVNVLNMLKKDIGEKVLKKRGLLDDKEYLRKNVIKDFKRLKVSYNDELFENVRYYFIRDLVNFGRVDTLVKDDLVREIICDGVNRNVIVNYKGNEVETNIVFNRDEEIDKVVLNLAEKGKIKLDIVHPFLNVNIGNLRVQGNIKSGLSGGRFIIKKI